MSVPTTYKDNIATKPAVSNAGLKISKPGFNANTAADTDLIFSSAWPSLPVAYQTNVPIGTNSVNHGLNFPPFTMVWAITTTHNNHTWSSAVTFMGIPSVDSTIVDLANSQIVGLEGQFYSQVACHIKCFNIDLTKDIEYPQLPNKAYVTQYDPSYGIKVARPGKSTLSKDLRDYVLHSRCQSPLILAVKTEKTYNPANSLTPPAGVVQYTNKQNLQTWNFGFNKTATGKYLYAPLYAQSVPRTFSDGVTSYVNYDGATYTGATLVVLRDPMFPPNVVSASY